jgi:hypothetical protein
MPLKINAEIASISCFASILIRSTNRKKILLIENLEQFDSNYWLAMKQLRKQNKNTKVHMYVCIPSYDSDQRGGERERTIGKMAGEGGEKSMPS